MNTETVELLPGDSKIYSVSGRMRVVLLLEEGKTIYIQADVNKSESPNISAKYVSDGSPLYLGAGTFKLWNSKGSESAVVYSILIGEV